MLAKGLFHPGSLTSIPGSAYSNSSTAIKARHAAMCILAISFELYTGSRPAETLRWKFSDTRITTPDGSEVPVWTLGLAGAGVLPHFQGAVGTGFEMTSYHCKFLMGMGEWDVVDILPASMSGEPAQFVPQLTQP